MAKLLVVDDQEANRYLLEVLLNGHGHSVATAGNGVEALAKARQDPPEVIITDIPMPEMDGFALCRAWKKDPALSAIPLIFYTATYTDPKDEKFALSLGAARFIVKPTEPELFMAILEEVLGEHREGRLAATVPLVEEEGVFLREYNQALIHKLEDKIGQLEQANKRLVQEVEERKRAERELRRSEEKYRTLMEAVADPVIVYDRGGNVMYINQAFTRVFGWTAQEVAGQPLDLAPPGEGDQTRDRLYRAMAGEPCHGWEGRSLTKDHRMMDVNLSAACLRDDEEALQGIVVSLQDTTQKKQAEQEQEKLKTQLIQSQKMESLGTLAGGIAHDFNNLLAVMTGFSELALDCAQGQESASQHLRQVIKAGHRATDLVRKILTFSRRTAAEMRPLDLNREIGQAVTLLERTLPKMISVHTHLAGDLKTINGDPNELEQVIINLATNAQDAMPQGGRLVLETNNVTVAEDFSATYLKVAPGDYVLLQISDTGQGMDAHIREQIFDPFFTTKAPGKGTGLGLSTVYGIVKSHGGHISCYSEPGYGTTFKIYLPVFHEAEARPSRPTAEQAQPAGGHESILLVDDEKLLLELGETLLSRAGYQVMTAQSGEEAVALYGKHMDRLDLVITDLGMPGMGGYKTLKTILEINPRAKVVIASGYTANSHVKNALESGAVGYVAKPFGRVELLNKIRQALDGI
ncbi:MAG: response regulator [Desulfarculus sp.]|nr:response regulator [Desulfarculus sp.]